MRRPDESRRGHSGRLEPWREDGSSPVQGRRHGDEELLCASQGQRDEDVSQRSTLKIYTNRLILRMKVEQSSERGGAEAPSRLR